MTKNAQIVSGAKPVHPPQDTARMAWQAERGGLQARWFFGRPLTTPSRELWLRPDRRGA